ncbi:MAG TPA: hypothetical protein VGG89_10565 [Candidatus Baltobacteraceae bacterium]|jgi:hypothetical protein
MIAPIAWQGIELGAPVAALRERLGDPSRVLTADDHPEFQVRRYWIAGADSTFVLVISRRGYIEAVHVFTTAPPVQALAGAAPDPSGVRLGDTLDDVKTKHSDFTSDTADDGAVRLSGRASQAPGVVVTYEFAGGKVRSFQWTIPVTATGAAAVPAEPSGDSATTAILDVQGNEFTGVRWEYMYVAFHPCDEHTSWKPQQQALLHANGRSYDRLHVVCPTTKAERDFYFDITSYFGKT